MVIFVVTCLAPTGPANEDATERSECMDRRTAAFGTLDVLDCVDAFLCALC